MPEKSSLRVGMGPEPVPWCWGDFGQFGEGEIIVLFQNSDLFNLIFVAGLLPQIWGPLPDFGEHSPFLCGDKIFPKYVKFRVERRYLVLVVFVCFFFLLF